MNRDDEYFNFLMIALAEAVNSRRRYFFCPSRNLLFSFDEAQGDLRPHYRNAHVEPNAEEFMLFEKLIDLFLENENQFIELSRIETSIKKEFLLAFIDSNKMSIELKNMLENEIINFDDNNDLNFKINLRERDYHVYKDFNRERTLFLAGLVATRYPFLSLDKTKEVLW